jgi:ribosomal protein S18 acetylase RimI-like enzyme
MKQTTIRKGGRDDAHDFARLYLTATRDLYPTLVGPRVTYLLENIYRHTGTIFSYEHAHFIEHQGRTAGLVMLNTLQDQLEGTPALMRLVIRYMHVHLIGRTGALLKSGEISAFQVGEGDLYLQALAVYPEFRGRGLGSKLLDLVSQTAAKTGSRRVVLACEVDNNKAIRFYKNHGYETHHISPPFIAHGMKFQFHQMTVTPVRTSSRT